MGINLLSHIVGVDGGGTGCRAAIAASDGTVLGTANGGAANFTTDAALTITNVNDTIRRAAKAACLTAEQLHDCVAHVGLAGILRDADAAKMAATLPFRRVCVTDDQLTSLTGALGARDGILAAVGTGTLVVARKGKVLRSFGGWGLNLSDQASGAWLGRCALERCLLIHDGLEMASDLSVIIMEKFGNDPAELVSFAQRAKPCEYAALALMVADAALANDVNGRWLMQQGANYLNACFRAASAGDDAAICLSGGLGPRYNRFIDTRFGARLRPSEGSALDGALHLAQRELHAALANT